MAWGSVGTSDSLNLSSSFQTVQESASDLSISLNPGESAHVQLDYNPQDASPTENCLAVISASPDGGSNFDSDEHALYAEVLLNSEDPARRSLIVSGVHTFRIRAKLIDADGSDGGDDTATLTVRYRKNGISL